MNHSTRFTALVQTVKQRIQELTLEQVSTLLETQDSLILIDVREDNEWDNGRLPKAIHLSKGIIERDIEKTIPDLAAKIVLYCGGGSRSALAADNLQKMGYQNVFSMAGGYRGWIEAGYKLAEG